MINYKFQEQKDVPNDLDWLHPSELEIYENFRFEKRKNDWLLGRWTAKTLLKESRFPDKKLNELAILAGENRAPFVFLESKKVPYRISISHSHGRAFCTLSREERLMGCDLERIERRSDMFVQDYFSSKENELFHQNSDELTKDQFINLCWSTKEAIMKATRQGMSLHPNKISIQNITVCDNKWNLILAENIETAQVFYGRWQFVNGMVAVIVADEEHMGLC